MIEAVKARGVRLLTVGTRGEALRLISREPTQLGQSLVIAAADATYKIDLPLIGAYQVANALVSAGLVIATGGDTAQTLGNLARLQPVRGRLERAAITKAGAPVYVDYAHPPAIAAALVRCVRTRRAADLVFGRGDRDQAKRPEMGKVAAAKADVLIVTDDNPRGGSCRHPRRDATVRRPRRSSAIAAPRSPPRLPKRADDIVCIAGKGHEQGRSSARAPTCASIL